MSNVTQLNGAEIIRLQRCGASYEQAYAIVMVRAARADGHMPAITDDLEGDIVAQITDNPGCTGPDIMAVQDITLGQLRWAMAKIGGRVTSKRRTSGDRCQCYWPVQS